MKIAILVREETALRCTGKGCLDAFFAKKEGFEIYQGKTTETFSITGKYL